jgi:hypothetical protein
MRSYINIPLGEWEGIPRFKVTNSRLAIFMKNSQKPMLTGSSAKRLRGQILEMGCRSGKSCHRAPVRKIHKMPFKTSRLSAGERQTLGFLRDSGSSGTEGFQRFPLVVIYEACVFSHWRTSNNVIHRNTIKVYICNILHILFLWFLTLSSSQTHQREIQTFIP